MLRDKGPSLLLALLLPLLAVAAPSAKPPSHVSKRFLHITDIHYDPFYVPHSDPSTQCHRAPASQFSSDTSSAPSVSHYGALGTTCDSPLPLVEDTFTSIKREVLANQDIDFVFWTGDSSRHDRDKSFPRDASEVVSQNLEIVYYLQRTFDLSRTIIIPSIGNWDVWPSNALDPGPNVGLQRLYKTWQPVLDEGASPDDNIRTTFEEGGWFKRTLVKGQVIGLSLNTLYWYEDNPSVSDCSVFERGKAPSTSLHPGDVQFTWLEAQLKAARVGNERVFLLGHVPPADYSNSPLYRRNCYKWYLHLTGEYSDVILGAYYGHVNKDVVSVLVRAAHGTVNEINETPYSLHAVTAKTLKRLKMDKLKVVGTVRTSSSIVPVHNPGFRTGIVDIGRTAIISEEVLWYADLVRANEKHAKDPGTDTLQYRSACKTRSNFKMHNLTAEGYTDWIRRMQVEEGILPDISKKPKKDRRHMLELYTLCMDSNEKLPREEEDDSSHLTLSPTAVRAILLTATITFLGGLGGFFFYVRRLEERGTVWERQRLLFTEVEPESVRRAQRAALRVRERGVDVHGVTI
ncbi:uncharacterized protein SPPG_04594 [Spizellomyces punctatus DAOM BR117]|uniref:Calcineurin-like phosphoesterase domain-containing protein n=1 Tax=Spizellomyces punctatus (strain DAOM BR117) TaxID=645134 RepID=A0A0L0HHH3_SPIPD|nr:uncharacterized protein SPPG_04594 [Spizellomyces punctatus DAOM BR117]KND00264.1 hypothetical protein SPPG_04594 [Spizellomyces punctatus DAOM BR117]|eukprot:XP_016608303.1 hypothetical protein SPPG_04594 [Spizellomyces punctatus DAOM BR117]